VARWRRDCGCSAGSRDGWTQAWRAPLRQALDFLRDEAARQFEVEGGELLRDPWAARDAYVEVVLDRLRLARQLGLEPRLDRPQEMLYDALIGGLSDSAALRALALDLGLAPRLVAGVTAAA
jgi:alpha-amylase/alpha-mannosidase (GH57 family)